MATAAITSTNANTLRTLAIGLASARKTCPSKENPEVAPGSFSSQKAPSNQAVAAGSPSAMPTTMGTTAMTSARC